MKAKVKTLAFGDMPTLTGAELPAFKSLKDDTAVAAVIGLAGGGIQRTLCVTAFYAGLLAKKEANKDYTFDAAWEKYYENFYSDKPLSDDSKRQAKSPVRGLHEAGDAALRHAEARGGCVLPRRRFDEPEGRHTPQGGERPR